MNKVVVGKKITVEDVYNVACNTNIKVELDGEALEKIRDSRKIVDEVLDSQSAIYGINTGFGSLSDVQIGRDKLKDLQRNLIRSHCAGVGKPLDEIFVRAIMLLKANNASCGYSGVRFEVIESLLFFLNHNIIPIIPEKGSVGASGDLAPLAHLTLSLIGEGEVICNGKRQLSDKVIKGLKGKILELEAKEGLALINGTQFMSGLACIGLIESESLLRHGDLIAALSVEGVKGSFKPFDMRISEVRPHRGQLTASRNLNSLCVDSEITASHKNCTKVQDPYSLRCIPQVHGAVRDAISYLRDVLSVEINSVTDNPLVFEDGIISSGNFHGEPVAMALDFAAIALTEMGAISERRIDKLLTPPFNSGLSAYLIKEVGLNSGFMIAQYTAAAVLNENKVLSHPACVDNIPTSNNKEDHVSMGATGARKFLQIVENLETILAIELMIAVEACEQRKPLKPSKPLRKVMEIVRNEIKPLDKDRVLSTDIEKAVGLIKNKKLLGGLTLE